jgi:hypothetical protein
MSASPLNEVAMFRLLGLDPAPFGSLFDLPDAELHARGIRRVRADADAGFPCRVSLRDAAAGEELLLLPYRHHDVASPYQAEGPIYVRRGAERASPAAGEVPDYVARRLISLRAYDRAAMMLRAEVLDGTAVAARLADWFGDEAVAYVHLHNARPGCYSCAAVRA